MKNNTSFIFCLKPYVKNGIFEKKIILVKLVFSKRKVIKFHIFHLKIQKQKKGKVEKSKTTQVAFLLKTLCKKGNFERKIILVKLCFFKKKLIKFKFLHKKIKKQKKIENRIRKNFKLTFFVESIMQKTTFGKKVVLLKQCFSKKKLN